MNRLKAPEIAAILPNLKEIRNRKYAHIGSKNATIPYFFTNKVTKEDLILLIETAKQIIGNYAADFGEDMSTILFVPDPESLKKLAKYLTM